MASDRGQSTFELRPDADGFGIESFSDAAAVARYCELFVIETLCASEAEDELVSRHDAIQRPVAVYEGKPYAPRYAKLCLLHALALQRRAITVLEFGSGFSTAILADAMARLAPVFGDWASSNTRCDRPFHVFAVEEEQRFVEITRRRLRGVLAAHATVSRSSLDIITHDSRIATVFSRLPNVAPDLIYLDGPSQYGTTAELNGFSFNSQARMPMSADILRFEFFLEPGTLVIIDGRTQNARFLRSYLRRNWAYRHDRSLDVHFLELQEEPIGPLNQRKLDFCLKGKWLLS
jgi:hypothetical protein